MSMLLDDDLVNWWFGGSWPRTPFPPLKEKRDGFSVFLKLFCFLPFFFFLARVGREEPPRGFVSWLLWPCCITSFFRLLTGNNSISLFFLSLFTNLRETLETHSTGKKKWEGWAAVCLSVCLTNPFLFFFLFVTCCGELRGEWSFPHFSPFFPKTAKSRSFWSRNSKTNNQM